MVVRLGYQVAGINLLSGVGVQDADNFDLQDIASDE